MERNPHACLQYKWLDNGIQLIWQSLQDLPNCQIKMLNKNTYRVHTNTHAQTCASAHTCTHTHTSYITVYYCTKHIYAVET